MLYQDKTFFDKKYNLYCYNVKSFMSKHNNLVT